MKTVMIIMTVVFLVLTPLFVIVGIIISSGFRGGQLAKGSGGIGNGCVLGDAGFSNTSIADNPEQTYNTLLAKYPVLKDGKTEVLAILKMGKEKNINPVLPLAIWFGEQTFNSPQKAFGYGHKDGGTIPGIDVWDKQLNGVYNSIADAMVKPAGAGNYTESDPTIKNTNMFTRLFWHYTTAMKDAYKNAGNRWDESSTYTDPKTGQVSYPVKARMEIIRLLVPTQIECMSGGGSMIASSCTGITSKIEPLQNYPVKTGIPKVIVLHSMQGGTGDGAREYFQKSIDQGPGGRYVYVQFAIGKDGVVHQLMPENYVPRGTGGYNELANVKKYGSNAISISIENELTYNSPDPSLHETDVQVKANIALIKCLQAKYNISKEDVISHEQAQINAQKKEEGGYVVPPGEGRTDPGKRFMDKVTNGL